MARLAIVFPFLVVALDVFGIVDVILIDERRVRALNKPLWIIIIVLLPLIGALLWFLVGRARQDRGGPQPRTVAPDDDPTFLRNLGRDDDQDERIRKLEQELAELDDDPPKD
jgi:hypothetical protein